MVEDTESWLLWELKVKLETPKAAELLPNTDQDYIVIGFT
jgi:hypothetical protein